VGKSTQAGRLVHTPRSRGPDRRRDVRTGATELGRTLRELLLGGEFDVAPRTEALLMAADRAQHVADVIEPALARGAWVVSDRFVGSSLAYQGGARGLGFDAVANLNRFATADVAPDVVVYLTAPIEVLRARQKPHRDRIESEGDGFLETVSGAYDELARTLGWRVVDATPEPDEVEEQVWKRGGTARGSEGVAVTTDATAAPTSPWDRLAGQDRAVALLRRAAERPVHAYLLVGARGSGVEDAARCFAAALVAPEDDVRAVDLALRGMHPTSSSSSPRARTTE
jgi:dTMP kinase